MAKTVEQIAKDLNLSVTTVRLVLSGKPNSIGSA